MNTKIHNRILFVDDEARLRENIAEILVLNGFEVTALCNGKEALKALDEYTFDLIIADYLMPEMNGLELLSKVRSRYDKIPFIILTAYGTIESAVEAIKKGADDYLQKPFDIEEMLFAINRVLDHKRLNEDNKKLRESIQGLYSFHNIVTRSESMIKALTMAKKAAQSPNTTIAIYGESGTGKEVLARAIHYLGERMHNRFVVVNCTAIPHTLFESELFGHLKGAFTGADTEREGMFGLANGGTILLDEIGDMPLQMQPKVLRVIQERSFIRLGANTPTYTDCRVIVATHRNLEELVKEGAFREDLYHRINVFPIYLPPLRERIEDIPLLVEHYLDILRRSIGKPLHGISQKAMDMLLKYHWPGNIRELKNCLERAAILVDNELIRPEHLSIMDKYTGKTADSNPRSLHIDIDLNDKETSLDSIVDNVLQKILKKCEGNRSLAADILKVNRKMFYRRGQ